jgi:4-hydroxybenzoate polyprenyltransferase
MNNAASNATPPIANSQSPFEVIKNYLELVKFSHTIFALPFALAALLVATKIQSDSIIPDWRILVWVVVAMAGARTAAMGFNRIADRKIDALNPRTKGRELPSGKVTLSGAIGLTVVASLLFFFAAYQINFLAFVLSPLTLATLFFYSLCKRFTSFSHFVLGLCLGIAPVGAWVAVTGEIGIASGALCAAVLFWVAGFDIIYATMDVEFDQSVGLHSMVRKLGIPKALLFAKILHVGFFANLILFGVLANLGAIYYGATALIGASLIYEHAIVKPDDLRRVNAAFFTVNGVIAVFFLGAILLDLVF